MTQTQRIQIGPVAYNATTQSFEALVTVHDGKRMRRYPCAIDAPISMSFEDASDGLSRQALRRHRAGQGLHSQMLRADPPVRAGRPHFDPRGWLQSLLVLPGKRAA